MAIHFYRANKNYGCFSNFFNAKFELDGEVWETVEHYYQSNKFDGFPEIQKEIKNAESEGMAKRQANGKYRNAYDFEKWMNIRDLVMYNALKAKFNQNPDLK